MVTPRKRVPSLLGKAGYFVHGYKGRWDSNILDGERPPNKIRVRHRLVNWALRVGKNLFFKGATSPQEPISREKIIAERRRLGKKI